MASKGDEAGDESCSPLTSPQNITLTYQPQAQGTEPMTNGPPGPTVHPHPSRPLISNTAILHEGKGHEALRPHDCLKCGRKLATHLRRNLRVGKRSQRNTPPLQFRDVMMLTFDRTTSQFTQVIQGLTEGKVPVRVLQESELDMLTDTMADEVIVASHGLLNPEIARRVLVVLLQRDASATWHSDLQALYGLVEHVIMLRPHMPEVDEVDYGSPSRDWNMNDWCDDFCLGCYIDVGDTATICCCPCCDDIGDCCAALGHSVNNCITRLCCDCNCCEGDIDCGDCGNCGDCCGDCGNCGDCCGDCGGCGDCGNCDCGDCNCDCVIM